MSVDSRYKAKIKKLLALAQSDNPHESEIAKRQAMALMKKHEIDADELDVVEVCTRFISRKKLKDFEAYLVAAVMKISGVYGLQDYDFKFRNDRVQWLTRVNFIGLERDAELAAYSFDVLHQQMMKARFEFKRLYRASAAQQDQFCTGWIISACEKLANVFGDRQMPEVVTKHYEKEAKGLSEAKSRKTQSIDSKDSEICAGLGFKQGKDAQLNQATTNQQEVQLRLGGGL
ncbi:DUF2786 domain-containing protein [Marinomonas sp. S3726]|uniref:DUF2786 domain-containing protein n=1 Tax=Marinomonas sp. S3726 TaxID=579484 RepID=UPI00069739A6|nr:DUF2786 domain-containing protein [Marinomonas sp. S3726]